MGAAGSCLEGRGGERGCQEKVREKRGFAAGEVSSEQSEGERRQAGFKHWMIDYRWGGRGGMGRGGG